MGFTGSYRGSPSTFSAGTEVTLPSTTFSPGAVTASFSSVASSAPVGCNAPVEPDGGGVLVWRHWNSICSGNWLLCQSSEEILECLRGDCWFDPWAFGHTYTFYNALLSCDDSHAMSCDNGLSSNASEDALNAECSGLVTCQTDGTWKPSINCWPADLIGSPSTSSAGTEVTLPSVELQTTFTPGAVTASFSSVASSAPVGCNAPVKPDSGGVLVWRHWNSICSGNWLLCQSSEEILQCLRNDCWFDPWAFGHSYTFYDALLSCDDSYAMSCGNVSSSNTSEDDQNAECSGLVTCQTDGTWKPSINCWPADLIGSPSTASPGTEVTLPSEELETAFFPGAVTTSFSSVASSAPVDPSTTQQAKIGTTSSSKLSTVTETTTSSFKPPSTTEMFSSKPTEIETTTSQSTPYTTNGVTSFGNTMLTQISVWIGRHIPLLAGIAIAVGMAIVVPLLVFVVKSKCRAASVASNAG